MKIISQIINIKTEDGINIYDVTPQIQEIINNCEIKQGASVNFFSPYYYCDRY